MPCPPGSCSPCTRTTSPTPSISSISSSRMAKRRFTRVPTGSGVFQRMKAPVRDIRDVLRHVRIHVLNSWFTWTRSARGTMTSTAIVGISVPYLPS